MEELQTTMTIYHVWGSHLGSSALFKQHVESRRKITEFVERMQVRVILHICPKMLGWGEANGFSPKKFVRGLWSCSEIPFHPYLSDYKRLNQVSGIFHKIIIVDEFRKKCYNYPF
jgi:hypothetical protein